MSLILRFAIVLLAVLSGAFSGLAASSSLQSVPLNGERYISLQKWARAKGFVVDWRQNERVVNITNSWARLAFNINSKKASLNGLTLWLSSAVPANSNTVYVSERDIFKLLHPILYPEKLKSGKKIRIIAIAAGHGGKDPGYQINKHQEKNYTLLMARTLQETLEATGFKVVMTRDNDTFVDLDQQAAIAVEAKADLFVTVHYNAHLDVEPKGVETFSLTPIGAVSTNGGESTSKAPGHAQDPFNALLAFQVHKSILQNTEFHDRGLRRANFMVLRQITMPGVYIEGGFLSNPFDAEKIANPNYRRKTARAITDGILAYKRLVERK